MKMLCQSLDVNALILSLSSNIHSYVDQCDRGPVKWFCILQSQRRHSIFLLFRGLPKPVIVIALSPHSSKVQKIKRINKPNFLYISGGRAVGSSKRMRVHSDDVPWRGQHVALSQCRQTSLHPHARLSGTFWTVGMHEAHRLSTLHRQKNRLRMNLLIL